MKNLILPIFAAISLILSGCVYENDSQLTASTGKKDTYVATVLSVHDGDTFKARVELGLGMSVTDTFRLNGVDCPELSTAHGKQVRDDVKIKMLDQLVVLRVVKRDKYGRWLADVEINGEDLAAWMISNGSAKYYNGRGPKPFSK